MVDNIYWLISITSDSARVSQVNQEIISQGQEISWSSNDSDSLLKAIDTSLSSQNIEATSNCAFIVPPSWVSDDGKISEVMLQKLKYICQSLKLKPLGFISHDDAFVESYDNSDSFPASYILVYFGLTHYHLSLVYLGQIKFIFDQDISDGFLVSTFEKNLSTIGFTSALPPKIIIVGAFTIDIVDDLTNYNWLSHKDIETFLHLPEVISVDLLSLDNIFINTIQKQISPSVDTVQVASPVIEADVIDSVDEIDADTFGFSADDSPIEININNSPPPLVSKKHFKIPSFTLPKINFNYYWLLPFTLLPFLPILPLFFAKVDVTIYQTPVEFNESFDVVLDPKTNVSQKSFDLSIGTSIAASGKKEVGEKAKGEIIVYNKSDRSISINRGLLITDVSGNKFETTNNILVPASTSNLDTGIINMGQIKAAAAAQTIGPESNLANNVTLSIKDNPNLLAKVSSEFTGGTRHEVAIVTQTDRNQLQENAKLLLKEQAADNINSQKSSQNSILESTLVFENQKSTFNREVGEATDILVLNLSAKVSFLYFDISQKQNMISTLFPQKENLSILDKNTAVVTINYSAGKLSMVGKANPSINISQLKSLLVKKKESELKSVLNIVPRYYQHDFANSLWYLNLLHRLPLKPESINIVVKN